MKIEDFQKTTYYTAVVSSKRAPFYSLLQRTSSAASASASLSSDFTSTQTDFEKYSGKKYEIKHIIWNEIFHQISFTKKILDK